MSNIVYIATSLDGYIADKNGGLDWLHTVPNPDNLDLGFADFIKRIDAIVMGRNTFETVCSFGGDWPYTKPVFVLSHTISSIPEKVRDHAELIHGTLSDIESELSRRGYNNLYIDGGVTIQVFLKEDRIDELIITTIPILLGGGTSLFGELSEPRIFELINSEMLLGGMVQTHYRRK